MMKKLLAVLFVVRLFASYLPAFAETDYEAILGVLETAYYYYEYDEEIGEIYDEWMELWEVSGHLVYAGDEVPWDTEYECAMIAYDTWTDLCQITDENDYSEASMVMFFNYENGDFQQNLVLTMELHDNMIMPDFSVLMDFDTKEILATTDVAYYCECLDEAVAYYGAVREDAEKVIAMATEAVVERYQDWDHPITEAVLAIYDCCPLEPSDYWIDENGDMTYNEDWIVYFFPSVEGSYEFLVMIDMNQEIVTDVERDLITYPNFTQNDWQRSMDSLNDLEQYYLDAIAPYGDSLAQAPLEVRYDVMQYIREQLDAKSLYDWLMLCMEDGTELRFVNDVEVFMSQALPGEDDIQQEVALAYAKELLYILGYQQEEVERWNCNVFCYEGASSELVGTKEWYVAFTTEDEVFEYAVELDARSGLLLYASEVDWAMEEYTYLEPDGEQLEAYFGPFQDWTLDQKMRYGYIFGWYEYERKPVAEALPEEEAIFIAKQALINAFDDATMEELNTLDLYKYYYNYVSLFDVDYDEPVYYFAFMTPDLVGSYEVVMNAVTGEILVLHDPEHSGNG